MHARAEHQCVTHVTPMDFMPASRAACPSVGESPTIRASQRPRAWPDIGGGGIVQSCIRGVCQIKANFCRERGTWKHASASAWPVSTRAIGRTWDRRCTTAMQTLRFLARCTHKQDLRSSRAVVCTTSGGDFSYVKSSRYSHLTSGTSSAPRATPNSEMRTPGTSSRAFAATTARTYSPHAPHGRCQYEAFRGRATKVRLPVGAPRALEIVGAAPSRQIDPQSPRSPS
eukprot:scaffold189739_cov31-Tisochrysis_lutea.AAC.2